MHRLNDPSILKTTSYINGQWLTSNHSFEIFNPSTRETITRVDSVSDEQLTLAVESAKTRFQQWSSLSANERSETLMRWYELIMTHQDDLATLMTLEQGKPLKESKGEIKYGAQFVLWFAEEAKRIYGDTIPSPDSSKRILVLKQPVGVVAAITPWNFPSSMITRKAAPALAAGCTFIVKPSEETPLSALALAELAHRAGIPAGVFNVVVSDASATVGKTLTTHPDIAKFSFTGSTAVGKQLLAQCASTVKKVSLELGGNAPFIVFEDADVDNAVDGAIASKFRNSGQTCVCANRFLVQASIYSSFTKKFTEKVSQLSIGDGFDSESIIGPLITQNAANNIHQRIEDSVKLGAKVLTGGQFSTLGNSFYQPTVLSHVSNDMPVASNEIFGPVAPIISFTDEQDALAIANDTRYGLAAYFYTRDLGRIFRVSEQLEYGMVGVNEGVISNPTAPFGGVKESGIGREGSKYGIEEYIEEKYVCLGGLN